MFLEICTELGSAGGFGMHVLLAALPVVQAAFSECAVDSEILAVVAHDTASENDLVQVLGISSRNPRDALAVVRAGEGTRFASEGRTLAADGAVVSSASCCGRGSVADPCSRPRG